MFMCIGGTNLFLPTTGEVVDYNKIICKNNPPAHAIRKLTHTCANNFTLIEAGLTVGTTFSPTYTVCFDHTLLTPFYVEFTKPSYKCTTYCGSTLRLHVDAGSLYNVDLDLIYIRQETIFKNLDLEASFKPLQQVSLVDNQLFVNPARWYPTFDYANHVFNWASFDGTPSDFCFNYLPASSVIYAGVLGVTEVSNSQGKLVEVYLNDGTVPVPQWYWCVFYDKSPQVDGVFFVQYTAMMATVTSSSGAQVLWQNEICSEDTYVYNDQLGEFYGNCTFSGLVNPLLINFVDEKWPQARTKSLNLANINPRS